ncbi:MAG: hypothetical protein DCC71_13430 [Proteobacteria bacterium]|nr:MAG: hypothetical protein DCC71_13430 [Pseudomonadota bacterium]
MEETRTPEEIEREIEATRTNLEGTVEELGERLAPRRLVDDAVGRVRHSAARSASHAWSRASDSMRDNAIPLVLIGGGIAWWLASRRSERYDRYEGYERPWGDAGYPEYRSMSGQAGQRQGVGETARALGEHAMERGGELRTRAREGLHHGVERAQHGLHQGMERAQHGFQSVRDDQPILLGLASLALGALVGGSLPSTQREDEMLGHARDQVVQRAAEAGREKAEQVRHAAEEAAGSGGDGAGNTGSDVQQQGPAI